MLSAMTTAFGSAMLWRRAARFGVSPTMPRSCDSPEPTAARIRDEGSVMESDRRSRVVQPSARANRQREEPMDKAKPFDIPKREVWEAFKRVKANWGAADEAA